MKTYDLRQSVFPVVGILLSLPGAFFIFISIMKYSFGWDYPYDVSSPTLIRWGLSESLGWNINALIFFGPLISFFLNLANVLSIHWQTSKQDLEVKITISKRRPNLVTIAFSGLILFTLFAYLVAENL